MIKTLIISTELPTAPMTGGRIRTGQLAHALARLGPVTIAGFSLEPAPARTLDPPLRAVAVPWDEPPLWAQMQSADESASRRAYQLLAEATVEPWIVSRYESAGLRQAIRQLCDADLDLVLLEHTLMGAYLAEVPLEIPTVLDLHNVHWRMAKRAAARGLEDAQEVERVRAYERGLVERCTVTLVVSDAEAAAVGELAPRARVEVVPNGVDTKHFAPAVGSASAPDWMLFTGLMNYAPNVEAVTWFASEVLPRLDAGVLHVVGSTPSAEVEALVSERVIVHGEVPDTRPYQWRASVVVAPLLSGAGTRLKILEAAACGNAIVSTTLGAEGLDLVARRDLLIANTPAEFADAVTAVLADGQLRARLGHNARRAAEKYNWEWIGEHVRGLVRPLVRAKAAQPRLPSPVSDQLLSG